MDGWKLALKYLAGERVFFAEPLKNHTTFRVGGLADCFWTPASAAEFLKGREILQAANVSLTIIGNGSNLLVLDGGVAGCVVSFAAPMARISIDDCKITAEAGALLGAVSNYAAKNGLVGLEFAVGIPGSLGGAVYMNAGAYGGEMKDVVSSVTAVMPDGTVHVFSRDELAFGYRHSIFQENAAVILSVEIDLAAGEKDEIAAKMREIQQKRHEKQPLDVPSAGSTFKRPSGYFAAALIEQAGLKGYRVGGACVSAKHAGFIVNDKNGTAADILAVVQGVREKVFEKFGVNLELEVKVIGREKE